MNLFSFTRPAPKQKKTKWCECEQPDFDVRDTDECRLVHCMKCDGFKLMQDMFNNLLERVKRLENK